MIANFDYFNRFEQPIISLRKPNDKFIGFVSNIKNLNINPEFNAVSELTCDVYEYGEDNEKLKIYDDIKVKCQLFVEEVGFFIITECNEHDNNEGKYKSLTLYSCEHEISYKKLTYFNGTYKFWDASSPDESLMGQILNSLPRWSIGHIDETVAEKHRTFDEPDTTIYSFLMDDVEESYECLFEFDIINRIINVYDKNNYIHKTTILLTKNDVIESISVNTKAEEIFTALSLYGDDEITYSGINPLGGAVVYNFDYYKSDMSEELQEALNIWEENILKAELSISSLRTDLSNKYTEKQSIQSQIDSINEQITLLEKQLGVNALDSEMVSSLNSQIKKKRTELSNVQSSLDEKQAEIDAINVELNIIHESCSFKNNFTTEQLSELDAYIFECSEVDDTFAFTDDMTYEEQEEILVGLYNKAKSMLVDISTPTEELSLDSKSFIFQKEFLPYTEQLNTGVIVDIEDGNENILSYVLLKMDVNYQDKTLELTFGNKYRSSDAEALWKNWESNVSKSTTTLSYERSKYGKAVNSGSLDKMNAFMNSSLDLTLNQVKSSDGQSFEVTDSGIKGRRVDLTTGQVDKEQIWLTANSILFTDNAWETIKTAIGRLLLADGSVGYGVNAEYLIGKMILGNNMNIANEKGSVEINEGITITTKHDGTVNNALLVQRENEDGTLQKQMHIDSNGNIVLTNGAVIEGSGVTVQQADGSTMTFVDYIQANSITAEQIEAIKAEIMSAVIKDLSAEFATIEQLKAVDVKVEGKLDVKDLEAEVGKFGYITVDDATFKEMQSDIGKIDTLIFGSAGGSSIQTEFSNSVIAQLGDAQIKSAMIEDMSVDKLKAGTMYTDDITIASKSGNTILSDNTLQFSDDTRVRIQIGKDASGDYSINLWDKDGNLMLSEGGITDAAIKEAIIRNDMISDDANIDAGKLDIDSLFTEINGSSNTIKSTKIYLDDKNQTLDVSFKEMSTTVEDLESTQKSQGTDISVIQGQIESKIWEQDIENVKVTNSVNGTTPLTLENSADGKVIDFSMSGKTEQRTTTGKNLLDCSGLSATTINGITFTPVYKANGELDYINVNGTATDVVRHYISTSISLVNGVSYLLSGCPSGGSSSTYSLRVTDEKTQSYAEYGSGLKFSYDDVSKCNVHIYISSGTTVSNLKFYPMIRLASNTDATYEPFTNGASPNPDYPQSLNHTGDVVEMMQGYYYYLTGVYNTHANRVCNRYQIPCKSGDTISITLESGKVMEMVVNYYSDNGFITAKGTGSAGANKLTITVPDGATYFNFSIENDVPMTPSTVGKITLTINDKYVLQFVEHEKNFSKNNNVTGTGSVAIPEFLPKGTYTISCECTTSDTDHQTSRIAFTYVNGGGTNCYFSRGERTSTIVTFEEDVYLLTFFSATSSSASSGDTFTFANIQIEQGEIATEFEEYKEKVATVLLNAPLRESDVMDRTEVARKRASKVFNGGENWTIAGKSEYGYQTFYVAVSDMAIVEEKDRGNVKSDKFIPSSTSLWSNPTGYYVALGVGEKVIYISVKTTDATNVSELKTWLSENNVEIEYPIEEVIETLDTDSQIALNSLETSDTVTYINVDSRVKPSEVSVDYYLNTEEGKRLAKENANTESELSKLATQYSIVEQTLKGISTTVGSHTSLINGLDTRVSTTETKYVQLDNKFSWIVSGESQSSFTLTSEMAKLVSDSLVITDDSGSSTIISGGKIDLDELFAQEIIATNLTITGNSMFEGELSCNIGYIGGWTIDENALYDYNGTSIMTWGSGMQTCWQEDPLASELANNISFWAGAPYAYRDTAAFMVTRQGKLYAKDIEVGDGTINGGTITGATLIINSSTMDGGDAKLKVTDNTYTAEYFANGLRMKDSDSKCVADLSIDGGYTQLYLHDDDGHDAMLEGEALYFSIDGGESLDGYLTYINARGIMTHTAEFSGAVNALDTLSVTGELTASTTITASGEIISTNPNAFRMVSGNYGAIWRNDGVGVYLLLTASGDSGGSFNSLRPFTVSTSTGYVTIGNGLSVTSGGIAIANNTSLYVKNASGDNVSVASMNASNNIQLGVGVSSNLLVGSATNTARTQIFSKGRIDLLCDGVTSTDGNAITIYQKAIRSTINNVFSLGTSSYKFTTVYATNGTIQTSDRRLKSDIVDLDDRYETMAKLLVAKTFVMDIVDKKRRVGYIAQDLEEIALSVGLTMDDCSFINKDWIEREDYIGYEYSLDYSQIHTMCVSSIQKQVNELQNELAIIKAKISQLESKQLGQ